MDNVIDVEYTECVQLSLFDLPERVVTITGEINIYKEQAAMSIWEIGKRLCEAKELLEHGQWLPWLSQFIEISERSAQNFMSIYREYPKSATVADLGVRKALILKGLSPVERDEFIAENHEVNGVEKSVKDMTAKELEKALAERDKAIARAEKAEADIGEAVAGYKQVADDYAAESQRLAVELQTAKAEYQEIEAQLEKAKDAKRAAEKKYKELKANPEIPREILDKARAEAEAAVKAAAEAEQADRVKELEKRISDLEAEKAAKSKEESSAVAKVEELKKKLQLADPTVKEFEIYFGQFQSEFNRMKGLLMKMDGEIAGKLKGALGQVLSAMQEGIS